MVKLKPLFLQEKLEAFLRREGKVYLVGGYVRDLMLGRETRDIDIAVEGSALEVARRAAAALGGSFVPLDQERGIARVVGEGFSLDFVPLKGEISRDLAARDFTVDAIALTLDGEVVDPFGGREDLEARLIRALGERAFEEDPVRLLRAVRLAGELGFEIEGRTQGWISSRAGDLRRVAGERSREELMRLLSLPRAREGVGLLDRLGLLLVVFPELGEEKGVVQPPEHYWDVYQHSLAAVGAVGFLLRQGNGWPEEALAEEPWGPFLEGHFGGLLGGFPRWAHLKLTALLHDIGKPRKRTEEGGRIRFIGHAQEGAEMLQAVMERLRFSRRETELVQTMVIHHLRPAQMGRDGEPPTRRAIYRYFRDTGEAAIDTLFLSLADHLATRGPLLDMAEWRRHAQATAFALEEHLRSLREVPPPKLVDGCDIMELFHLPPGPIIGELLEGLREAQAAGEVGSREEALAWVEKQLKKEGS